MFRLIAAVSGASTAAKEGIFTPRPLFLLSHHHPFCIVLKRPFGKNSGPLPISDCFFLSLFLSILHKVIGTFTAIYISFVQIFNV